MDLAAEGLGVICLLSARSTEANDFLGVAEADADAEADAEAAAVGVGGSGLCAGAMRKEEAGNAAAEDRGGEVSGAPVPAPPLSAAECSALCTIAAADTAPDAEAAEEVEAAGEGVEEGVGGRAVSVTSAGSISVSDFNSLMLRSRSTSSTALHIATAQHSTAHNAKSIHNQTHRKTELILRVCIAAPKSTAQHIRLKVAVPIE